jgi:hypothetical protein
VYYELGCGPYLRFRLTPVGEDHGNRDSGRLDAQATGQSHGEPPMIGFDDEKLSSCYHNLVN